MKEKYYIKDDAEMVKKAIDYFDLMQWIEETSLVPLTVAWENYVKNPTRGNLIRWLKEGGDSNEYIVKALERNETNRGLF